MDWFRRKVSSVWNKLRGGFVQILSANVINKVVAVLSNMIITRVLSTSDYGSWTYVLNLYSYFSIVSAFGLSEGAFQFGAENRGNEKEFGYYRYCLKTGLFVNLGLVAVGVIGASVLEPALPGTEVYLIAYIPVLILEYIMRILTVILRCENRIKEYAKVLNINSVMLAIGTCVGAFDGITGVVVGKYTAYIFSLVILFILMKKEMVLLKTNSQTFYRKEINELWHFSIMACISSAMNSLLYLIDVSMVSSLMKDAEQTAIYKVATFAPNALAFIPSSVVICILPNLIAHNKDSAWLKEHVKKYFIFIGLANAVISAAVILMAPLIISILSGSKYLSAVPAFRVLMIGFAIAATFRTLSANILFGLKKVNINIVINIVAGGADLILNYTLITRYHAIGAACATVLAETIASVIAFSYVIWVVYFKRN